MNDKWISQYSEVVVNYLQPRVSDHSPLVVKIREDDKGCGRPFKFFSHMVKHDAFLKVVADS